MLLANLGFLAMNVRGYIKVRDIGNGQTSKTNLEFHLLP